MRIVGRFGLGSLVVLLLGGCAVMSNVHRQEGNQVKHTFSILGIPLWHSERPATNPAPVCPRRSVPDCPAPGQSPTL